MFEIRKKLNTLSENKENAFIPYFTVGYPNLETLKKIILESQEYFDLIEFGIPFSDPIADGSVIQESSYYAIKNGLHLADVFKFTEDIASELEKPIIYMMYYNQIINFGIDNFLKKISGIGVKGLIIPDLLPDSEANFIKKVHSYKIDTIFLTTPLTEETRLEKIIASSTGFIYFTQVAGVTGERDNVSQDLKESIKKLKGLCDTPVCVGFGISKPEHITYINQFADGTIVGSAIIKKIKENIKNINIVNEMKLFLKKLSCKD